MAYRYTMVDHNAVEGTYELYCYEDDDCIWQLGFETEKEAEAYGDRFLNGEFKEGFEVKVADAQPA